MTASDHVKRLYPFMLLAVYGVFLCSYFIFDEYSEPYRFYARVVFVLGIFFVIGSIREIYKQRLFQAIVVYMAYLLIAGFWSEPMDWFRLGQKLTISLYLISFFALTHFLVHWNRKLFERMLQLCIVFTGAAAAVSILVFYSENPFPATRLEGMGSLTNINEFTNVYGVFALLAMSFALRSPEKPVRWALFIAVGMFICIAWFGQSRTAFVSMTLALLALVGLMLKERRLLYAAGLAALAVALVIIFPTVIEQALLRGQGLRPQIWAAVWEEAQSAPILGHGFVSQISANAGGHDFRTAHNAYLQVFWQAGAVGLLLFFALLAVAFRYAWLWSRQEGDFSIFCILLFATCTMMTGVDTLIDRPRDQWMLFWFPLALLLSYLSGPSRSRFHNASAAPVQSS